MADSQNPCYQCLNLTVELLDAKLYQARLLGLLTTLHPKLEIDPEHPLEMAQEIVRFVNSEWRRVDLALSVRERVKQPGEAQTSEAQTGNQRAAKAPDVKGGLLNMEGNGAETGPSFITYLCGCGLPAVRILNGTIYGCPECGMVRRAGARLRGERG